MKALVPVLFALCVVGCVVPTDEAPICEEMARHADCGSGADAYREDADGNVSALIATCLDDWALSCSTVGNIGGTVDTVTCEDAMPACPRGGAPHCVAVPCDGEMHYGAGYTGP